MKKSSIFFRINHVIEKCKSLPFIRAFKCLETAHSDWKLRCTCSRQCHNESFLKCLQKNFCTSELRTFPLSSVLLIKLTDFPTSIYPKIVQRKKDNLSLPSTWKPRGTPRNWKVMASFSIESWEMGRHRKKNLIFHVTPHVTPFLEHWSNQEFIWLLKEPKAWHNWKKKPKGTLGSFSLSLT